MIRQISSGFAVLIVCGLFTAPSQIQAQSGSKPDPSETRRTAQEQRRNWVRGQLAKLVTDEGQRAEILARLDRLSDDQVQELATLCLDELEARKKQQFAALREHNARERAFREQLARQLPATPTPVYAYPTYPYPAYPYRAYPGPFSPRVGYFPVITWLPEGTSLTANAVVSPDGRHVRMSLAPFFSSIGPVYTFNYMTGETRRYDP